MYSVLSVDVEISVLVSREFLQELPQISRGADVQRVWASLCQEELVERLAFRVIAYPAVMQEALIVSEIFVHICDQT